MKSFKVIIKQRGRVPDVVSVVDKNDIGYKVLSGEITKTIPFGAIEYICSYSRIMHKRIKTKPAI